MINIHDEEIQLYKKINSSDVTKDYEISTNNGAIKLSNKELVYGSFKLEQKLCSTDTLKFGECNAAMLQFKCASEIGNIVGKTIKLKQIIDGTIGELGYHSSVELGEYIIDSCEITENKKYRTIIAYDNINKFKKDVSAWYEALIFPITQLLMFKSLCEFIGVGYVEPVLANGSENIEKTITADELQGITVLKSIAELNGGFFRANNKGKIEFVTLDSSNIVDEIGIKNYSSLIKEDFMTEKYTRLNIRKEEGDIGASVGNGDNAYIIEDNFLVYGKSPEDLEVIASNMFEVIKDISYTPYSCTGTGLPYLQQGDYVKYITTTGSFDSFILTRTLTGTQILKDVIMTKGTEKTEEVYGIEKEIIKLKNKSNILTKNVEETKSVINELRTNIEENYSTTTEMQSAITQTANEITQEISQTYTTKNEIKEVQDNINNLEIGGTNLIQFTKTMDGYSKSANVTIEPDSEGFGVASFAAVETLNWNAVTLRPAILFSDIRGRKVTFSLYVKSDDYELINAETGRGLLVAFSLCGPDTMTRTRYGNVKCYNKVLSNEWQRIDITAILTDDFFASGSGEIDDDTRLYIQVYDYSLYRMEIKKWKLELGDKATDWSPHPSDVDEKFTEYSTTTEMNAAIEQKADEINLSVSEKVTETNEGTVDVQTGTEIISNVSQNSYCLLTEINGYTVQDGTPTAVSPIELVNLADSFNIFSYGTETTKVKDIKVSAVLCENDKIVMADEDITINDTIVKKGDWYVIRNQKRARYSVESTVTQQGSAGTYNRYIIEPEEPILSVKNSKQYSNKYPVGWDWNSDRSTFMCQTRQVR